MRNWKKRAERLLRVVTRRSAPLFQFLVARFARSSKLGEAGTLDSDVDTRTDILALDQGYPTGLLGAIWVAVWLGEAYFLTARIPRCGLFVLASPALPSPLSHGLENARWRLLGSV